MGRGRRAMEVVPTGAYRRHGTTDLFAALDATTGNVTASMTPRHRSDEFRKFLNLIDEEVPEHLNVHNSRHWFQLSQGCVGQHLKSHVTTLEKGCDIDASQPLSPLVE